MFESLWLDCVVIVPDRLSYREMYFDVFKYDSNLDTNVDVQCEMIKYAVKNYDEYLESIKDNSEILKEQQGPKAVQRMLDIITEA